MERVVKMKSRIRKILEILLKSEYEQSIKTISIQLDVSEKTIRTEINQYIKKQKYYPVQIILNNRGYKAVVSKSISDLKNFLSKLDETSSSRYQITESVLKKLLLNEDYIKIERLAEEEYISVPTMNRIIRNIKKILEQYNFQIKTRPYYGVCIFGDEINKRLCYVHTLTKYSIDNIEIVVKDCNMTLEDYYSIDYIIRKSMDEKNYDLTEVGVKNLIIHLMYAITIMRNGSIIEKIQLNYGISQKETDVAQNIIRRLEEEFKMTFPPTEIDYVRIHLLSKRGNLNNQIVHVTSKVERIIKKIHFKIAQILGFDFSKDLELFSMLALHIEPMLSRIQYGIDIPNPTLKAIKLRFPTAYECAVIASDYLREHYGFKVSDDELGYLSLHYNLALERLDLNNIYQVLVICGSGAGTARLLQRKIESQFQINSNSITLCSVRELKDIDIAKYDIIVSSVKLPNLKGKKVIMIDDILSNIPAISFHDKSSLNYYLHPNLVFFQKDFKTREDVINFCCDKIINTYQLQNNFKEEVWKRENLSSTDIGNFVAIPHAFTMCTEQTIFCICILKKAIIWKQHKVKYVFLVSFGKSDLKISHEINEKLISLVLDAKWVSLLDSIQSFEELKNILV